jgi:hypothetical protein
MGVCEATTEVETRTVSRAIAVVFRTWPTRRCREKVAGGRQRLHGGMMSDSTFLTEKEGLRYSIATPEWQDRMVRILAEGFCREPMATALSARPEQMSQMAELFVPECASNGLSVIATPVHEPQALAGVFICRDFKAPAPAAMEKLDWLMPAMMALMAVDEEYERGRPALAAGDAVDLWMVAVDARFTGRRISNVLFDLCPGLAKQQGYKLCVTECTGHFSQSAARRAGFREAARLAYADYRFDGQALFADIPAPHSHLVLFEKDL